MELIGYIQNYEWGKVGYASVAAILYGGDIDPLSPYAELWMGTHPNGQAVIKEYNISLQEFLEKHQEFLGRAQHYWKKLKTLPFLMKVLSVKKALSIQCHPDRVTAAVLHQDYPRLYKDGNHKPEMAIALTKFHALCGFRPKKELKEFLVNVTELELVVTPTLLVEYKETMNQSLLKKILFSLLTKDEDRVEKALYTFFRRFEGEDDARKIKCNYPLIKRLHDQFPGDCGIFVAFFLNEVTLQPGEALYIPPGMPHAYLSGDCVECMSTSDNVVRAGLTPKYKDIETLLDILDYQSYSPEGLKLKRKEISPFTTHFNPPLGDFGVSRVCIPEGVEWVSPCHNSCQIFFVLEGEGIILGENLTKPKFDRDADNKEDNMAGNQGDAIILNSAADRIRKFWDKVGSNSEEKGDVKSGDYEESKNAQQEALTGYKAESEDSIARNDAVSESDEEEEEEDLSGNKSGAKLFESKKEQESNFNEKEEDVSDSKAEAKYCGAEYGENKEKLTSNIAGDSKEKEDNWTRKPDIKPVAKSKSSAEKEREEGQKYKTFLASSENTAHKSKKIILERDHIKSFDELADALEFRSREEREKKTEKPVIYQYEIDEMKLKLGTIMFLPCNRQYVITPTIGPLVIYFAYVNTGYRVSEISA